MAQIWHKAPPWVNEVQSVENQWGQWGQQVRSCGICYMVGHSTDACPTRYGDVYAMGGYPSQPMPQYNPQTYTYNEEWQDYSNSWYGNPQFYDPPPPPASTQNPGPSIDELIKALESNTRQIQQQLQASFKNVENSIGDLENTMEDLKDTMGQIETSLSEQEAQNTSTVTLESNTTCDPPTIPPQVQSLPPVPDTPTPKRELPPLWRPITAPLPKPTIPSYITPPPFPSRLRKSKKEEESEKEIPNICRKVEVNIPLPEAIKQEPRDSKVLKEVCTNKEDLTADEKVSKAENVLAVIQKTLPREYKDPNNFTIRRTTGNKRMKHRILDMKDLYVPCSTPVMLGKFVMKRPSDMPLVCSIIEIDPGPERICNLKGDDRREVKATLDCYLENLHHQVRSLHSNLTDETRVPPLGPPPWKEKL